MVPEPLLPLIGGSSQWCIEAKAHFGKKPALQYPFFSFISICTTISGANRTMFHSIVHNIIPFVIAMFILTDVPMF